MKQEDITSYKETQKKYWNDFSCFLKNKYLKGQVQRMEISIPGLPIKIRFDIYSDINKVKPDRINCITATLYTKNEKGFRTLNNKFIDIKKSFSKVNEISAYSEPATLIEYSSGNEYRIVVTKKNSNIYNTKQKDWTYSFKWMDQTMSKMLKLLLSE